MRYLVSQALSAKTWTTLQGFHVSISVSCVEQQLRFTAVVNFNSTLWQHVQGINILMVTSQWEGKATWEGGGGRLRRTRTVYEAESKWLSGRARDCSCVGEREREKQRWWSTPGCHHSAAESGCNKKHRITSPTPRSAFFPLSASQLADEGSAEALPRPSRRRAQDLWLPSTS